MLSYEDDENPATRDASRRKLKIIRRTILAENQRRLHKTLGQIVKPTVFTPLDKIMVPRHEDEHEPPAPSEVYQMLPTPSNATRNGVGHDY
jgi:hypothetical protein